jgi:hypothetical protein
LTGEADELVSSSPGRGAFGFFAQAFRLFCKTLI